MFACCARGGQNRASEPLELELQVVVSCHLGAVYWTCVVWESSQVFSPLSYLSSSILYFKLTRIYCLHSFIFYMYLIEKYFWVWLQMGFCLVELIGWFVGGMEEDFAMITSLKRIGRYIYFYTIKKCWADEMGQCVKVPHLLTWIYPGLRWWKGTTDSCRLFSDLHMCTVPCGLLHSLTVI